VEERLEDFPVGLRRIFEATLSYFFYFFSLFFFRKLPQRFINNFGNFACRFFLF